MAAIREVILMTGGETLLNVVGRGETRVGVGIRGGSEVGFSAGGEA